MDAAGGSVGGDRAQARWDTGADCAYHNLPVAGGVGRERPSSYAVVTPASQPTMKITIYAAGRQGAARRQQRRGCAHRRLAYWPR